MRMAVGEHGVLINSDTRFVPAYCMENRLAKLIPIDEKVDLLLKAARLEYDPLAQLPSEVVKALQAGRDRSD